MFPEKIERTCAVCDEAFVQDFLKILQCVCPDCRKGRKKKKAIVPETIDEHIEEEKEKSPEFKEAFEKEQEKLESEVKKDGADNSDHGESGKGV